MLRKPEFSYKQSIITNEPVIDQTNKKQFESIYYAPGIHVAKYVCHGRITNIQDTKIEIYIYGIYGFNDGHSYFRDIDIDPNKYNLKEGQEVIFLDYGVRFECIDYLTSNPLISIIGICDKKTYENAVRDSQKLPKGWLHEPYYTIDVNRGTKVYEFNGENTFVLPYMRPDNAPNTQYLIHNDDTYDVSTTLLRDRIVETTFTIIYPDDSVKTTKIIFDENEYDKIDSKMKVIK